ncbi:MAG: hypothetical protein JNK90_23275 [Planctomycetaceae bacterium]|nr:hypothetical protein [Planctomycetaceae bacterium]
MSLEEWKLNHWIRESLASRAELTQLFAVVDRELGDASIAQLSVDGRFMHAYDAALNLCTIALRASGYAVMKGQGHHKKTIEALPLCLGKSLAGVADEIEIASRKRGQAMYDRTGVVELSDADDLLKTAKDLRATILEWLMKEHAHLVPEAFLGNR